MAHVPTQRHRIEPRPKLRALVAAAPWALLLGLAAPAGPADAALADQQAASKLKRIEAEIKQREDKRRTLEDTLSQLSREVSALTAELIATARALQNQEETVTALETRLADLKVEEDRKAAHLAKRTGELARSLAALQRLSQQPKTLVLARPMDHVDSLRSAGLLAAVVPELKAQALDLGRDIAALNALRAEIERDHVRLIAEARSLARQREELDELVAKKGRERIVVARAVDAERLRLERLNREAADLRALVAKIEQESRARERNAGLAALPEGTRPFSSVRGQLRLPVRGRLVRKYNQPDETGLRSKGLLIETRPSAQVVAPYDGRIVYAGRFRHYGLLLIIAHGEGYHTLLAGLGRIDGVVGQWLLAGEPVGQMSAAPEQAGGGAKPTLYVELRRNGEPINPLLWIAATDRKVSG